MSVKRYDFELDHHMYEERPYIREDENPHGEYVRHADYAAVAERCGRLEAALRSLRSMCADNLDLGAEGPAYWEDCGDVINEALDDRKGAAP